MERNYTQKIKIGITPLCREVTRIFTFTKFFPNSVSSRYYIRYCFLIIKTFYKKFFFDSYSGREYESTFDCYYV